MRQRGRGLIQQRKRLFGLLPVQRDFGLQQGQALQCIGVQAAGRDVLQDAGGALQIAFLTPGFGGAQIKGVTLVALAGRGIEEAMRGTGKITAFVIALGLGHGIGGGAGGHRIATGQQQGQSKQWQE